MKPRLQYMRYKTKYEEVFYGTLFYGENYFSSPCESGLENLKKWAVKELKRFGYNSQAIVIEELK